MSARNRDPVLLSSFREMLVVLVVWIVAAVWSIGYCYIHGYIGGSRAPETLGEVRFVLGFSAWVFWGVVLPWVMCAIVSLLISWFVIRDEDLGVDPGEEELDDA